MKKQVFLLVVIALIAACTQPPVTPTPIQTVAPPTSTPLPAPTPTATLEPDEPPKIEEQPLPVLPSERDHHPYNWLPEDVKGLDPWGDSTSDATDIVAIYQREMDGNFEFRLDIMNFENDDLSPIYFAVDFLDGGSTQVSSQNSLTFEVEWDLLVSVVDGEFKLFDADFTDISDQLVTTEINRQLDFVFFAISEGAFADWDGDAFQIQALLLNSANSAVLDQTTLVATDSTTGRAKLVLNYMNVFFSVNHPESAASLYDGFTPFTTPGRENEREGERRGGRYMLDATERYEIPITINDVFFEWLPGNEYLRILERFRFLANKGLLDLHMTFGYGHFMPWQPDDVDAKAIDITLELRERLHLPLSNVFWPYEGVLTPGDIQVIKDAGFEAIYGDTRARDSFFGWIENFGSNPAAHKDEIETLRKIHQFNGMKFFFHTEWHNYGPSGFMTDDRWGPVDWSANDNFDRFTGTDQGFHLFWRKVLHDMATDPDQEQFFTIGTDMLYMPWLLPDILEWNFQWLASHPWIEVTTFSSIVDRDWEVIDHGELDVPPDKPLVRFPRPDSYEHYLSYFPQHYYGGISDGHDPSVPAGAEIEAYYDYMPYLRDGQLIPSGRIMGDDQTPGSIVYETLENLRAAPDNPITTIAWLSYFINIGEQTFHEGAALRETARMQANFLGQVNKIVAAADWAAEAETSTLASDTQVYEKDLDLDGELEYVMHNDRVFAIFENDGGRIEYAFAYDHEYGPVQLISPASQYSFKPSPEHGFDFQNGETAIPLVWSWMPDGAFVEDLDSDGQFEYELLTASIEGQRLTFSYQTRPVSKTFTLKGDTIHVHYERSSDETINLGFATAVNWLGIFDKDWVRNFEPIEMQEVLGWQMTSGGAVLLNMEGDYSIQTASFYDSPAREEMQVREDESTYTEGNWLCFPCSSIRVWDTQEVDFSLTLRAAPIDKSAYTPIPTPTPTLPIPTPKPTLQPSPTPSQGQWEQDYVVYADGLEPGWMLNPWGGSADPSSTTAVYEGMNAIELSIRPGEGIAFNGVIAPDILQYYTHLVFYFNSGKTADQNTYIEMFVGEDVLVGEQAYLTDYVEGGPIQPGEWYKVSIPLSVLNPEGLLFEWFNIMDASGNGASTFYIDEIRFVAAGP